jgi:NTE family protein
VKGLDKIVRSVQAFGREFSSHPAPLLENHVPSIGLALGGGFARGIAHIGILKVLEEEKIPIHFVAGTSVGALIGAAYCSGLSIEECEEFASRVRFRNFARWTLSRCGFASNQRMIGFLDNLLKVKTFEDLKIPLAVTATDFSTGEGVVFHSGPLVDPVRASCAYPGMFLPVRINGRLLVDGMLAYPVPAQPLREMGAGRVLAISLKGKWTNVEGPRHVFEVIGQCFAIAQEMNSSQWKQAADLVVEPDVHEFKYDAFDQSAALVRAGEVAMRAALPEVRKWLQTHPLPQEKLREPRLPKAATVSAD